MAIAKLSTTDLLFTSAKRMGLKPKFLTKNLFTITTIHGQRYIHFSKSGLNTHIGSSLSTNKYLTRVILREHRLVNIPFTLANSYRVAAAFLSKHKIIVAKPIRGMGAKDIHIISTTEHLSGLNYKEYIFEQYIVGREIRYLVLNNKVIAVHESSYGTSVDEHRPLKRISYLEDEWDPELVQMSLKIANIMRLRFAAVDYLVNEEGEAKILEVNNAPGLKWFHSPSSGPPVDVAQKLLQALADMH